MNNNERHLVALVGCGSAKRDLPDAATCPVGELYTSGYFADKWGYAGEFCTRRYVLSAEHGIVEEGTELGYYETHINDLSEHELDRWVADVSAELRMFPYKHFCDEIVVLAGRDYIEPLAGVFSDLIERGASVHDPFFDLGGLPEQRGWLNEAIDAGDPMLAQLEESDDESEEVEDTESQAVEEGQGGDAEPEQQTLDAAGWSA